MVMIYIADEENHTELCIPLARRAHNIFDSGAIAKQYAALNSDIRSLQSKSCAVILITTPHSPRGGNFLRCVPDAELPRQEASERVIGAAVVHARRDFASHALSLLCVSPHSLVPPHVPPNVCRLYRERKKTNTAPSGKHNFILSNHHLKCQVA